jgi:hypothetical protein
VSNRSSNSPKNLRALCLREENDECWGCRKSGSRNGGRVILQTGLRSTRHRLGYAARLQIHGQIPQSQSPGPILTPIPKVETLARIADAKHIVFSIATTRTLGKR